MRRECDTTTNRFADSLWILRDERARAVLALSNELDEHSHTDRKPTCESGKIDDTFQSLQNKLAKEGAARGAVARHDAHMIPIIVIRTNPNKYDKKIVNLPERVKAAAKLINSYLHMDAEAIAKLQTHAAIVHVMFYHTKEGFAQLGALRHVGAPSRVGVHGALKKQLRVYVFTQLSHTTCAITRRWTAWFTHTVRKGLTTAPATAVATAATMSAAHRRRRTQRA